MSATATPDAPAVDTDKKESNKKPGFTMKQLSSSVNETVEKLAAQLDEKQHTIFSAGVLVFNTLSVDDQFKVIMEAKKLHAQKVRADQEAKG